MVISVAFNILTTLMISLRLLLAQRKFRKVASREDLKTYTGVVAILVESAFPLAAFGLIDIVFYVKRHPTVFVTTSIWAIFVVRFSRDCADLFH